MGRQRNCNVTFRDHEGVEHSVTVEAESLYEAAALALERFRKAEWSREESLDAATLRVEVCEPPTFYRVRVASIENWLERSGGAPRDVAARQRVRAATQGRC